MKYRTKLFISFSILTILCTVFSLIIVYRESYRLIFRELRHKGTTLAASAAAAAGNRLKESSNGERISPELQAMMQRILTAIRQVETDVDKIYIKIPVDQNSFKTYLAVPEVRKNENLTYPKFDRAAFRSTVPISKKRLVWENQDRWLLVAAPLFAPDNQRLGTLYLKIDSKHLADLLASLAKKGLTALLIVTPIAVGLAFFLARSSSRSLLILKDAVDKVSSGDLKVHCELHSQDEFQKLAATLNEMIEGLRQRERLVLGFARYVSTYVLEKILDSDIPAKLEGERRLVTVLFSDIRKFTLLAESLSPEKVLAILNQYFAEMIDIIFTYQGTLDKFLGDAVVAEFGAPVDDKEQEKHAILAALGMQFEMNNLNNLWRKEGLGEFEIGIGIYTGLAVIGDVGSEKKMEYTAIGEAVDNAKALEAMTKTLEPSILVSKETYCKVKEFFTFDDLGKVSLPQRSDEINVYGISLEKNLDAYCKFFRNASKSFDQRVNMPSDH